MQRLLQALSTEGSIRRKISLALLVAIVLVFPPLMGVVDLVAHRSIQNKVESERRVAMLVDARAVSKPLFDFDYGNVQRLASVIAARGDVDRVEVLDAAGDTVATADSADGRRPSGRSETVTIRYSENDKTASIGALKLWFNDEAANAAMQEFHWKSSFAIVAALVAVFIALMVALRQVLLRPLHVLMDAIERSGGAGGGLLAAWDSRDEMGRLVGHFNAMQTRLNEDAAKLRAALANFSTLYNQTPAMLFSLDDEGRIVDVSDYWVNETGYRRDEALGRSFGEFLADQACAQDLLDRRRTTSDSDTGFQRWNCKFRKKNGQATDVYVAEAGATLRVGERRRKLLVMVDISELKRAEAQLLRQARTDSLTGLPNRRHFKERLSEELIRAENEGGRLNVFFIDLDRFKWINDNLGHHAGDEVLGRCSQRITEILPEDAFFARLGGDEFAIFTHGDEKSSAALSHAINEALNDPFKICGSSIAISASIGIACYLHNANNVGDLLRAADLAMYRAKRAKRAKRAGRRGFSNYDASIGDEARRLFDLEKLMKTGAPDERYYLDFQPIVRLRDQKVAGAEGLLRMRDAEGRVVPPNDFIPVAEEIGMMPELGAFALARGASDFRAIREQTQALRTRLSINLSAVQVTEDLPEQVMEVLEQSQYPADRLVLEVTESVFLKQDLQLLSIFERLRALGCKLALDDFGTGYSSLGYLNDFPINIVKIDRQFVRRLDGDGGLDPNPDLQRRSRALLQGVVAIAQELELETVAEGVETDAQRRLVQEMGVDYGQGYLWSKPISRDDFALLLSSKPRQISAQA